MHSRSNLRFPVFIIFHQLIVPHLLGEGIHRHGSCLYPLDFGGAIAGNRDVGRWLAVGFPLARHVAWLSESSEVMSMANLLSLVLPIEVWQVALLNCGSVCTLCTCARRQMSAALFFRSLPTPCTVPYITHTGEIMLSVSARRVERQNRRSQQTKLNQLGEELDLAESHGSAGTRNSKGVAATVTVIFVRLLDVFALGVAEDCLSQGILSSW